MAPLIGTVDPLNKHEAGARSTHDASHMPNPATPYWLENHVFSWFSCWECGPMAQPASEMFGG